MDRIEGHHVGQGSRPQHTAVLEPQPVGGERRHFSYRLGEGQHVVLARVAAEHTRKRAVASRMGFALAERSLGGEGGAVGADHHVRVREGTAQIRFVELEQDHVSLAVLGEQEIAGRVEWILAPGRGDLR